MKHSVSSFFGNRSAPVAVMVLASAASWAQVPNTNFCQTFRGICTIGGFGPIGYPCSCGIDQGRLVVPPNYGTLCGTQFGMCLVAPGPLGMGCSCGGPPGRIVGR
jgi:hypothetical protein